MGSKFGDATNPLLLSVRSGAAVSCWWLLGDDLMVKKRMYVEPGACVLTPQTEVSANEGRVKLSRRV